MATSIGDNPTLLDLDTKPLDLLPAAVYVCDAEGVILYYNRRAAELWGRSPEVGKDRWCGSFRMFRPDGSPLPHDECPMAVTLREGRSVSGEEIIVEREDGVRIFVLPSPVPLHDGSHAIVGAVNLLVDITERKRVDDTARLLAAIVESSDDAIVSKTLHGIVTSWNRAAESMFGYSAEEMIGRHISVLAPPDKAEDMAYILGRIKQGDRLDHYETKRKAKDGRVIDVSLTVSPVRDASGTVVGASKIARDITERKRMEEALRRSEELLRDADRRKDHFLAMLAHELRNPISAINSAVQVIRKSEGAETLEWSKDVIERQVKHLSRLIDDLLDVSRISQGKIELRKTVVDAGDLLNNAVETVRAFIKERKHELNLSFPVGSMPVEVDPVRLEQVVVNLLTNAAKYTPAGGRISLSAERVGADIVIHVQDNGLGIAPEKLPEMFELFTQAETALDRSEGGLGIGLALVKSLVEMHGGTVSASSEGCGKGSTFSIRLAAAKGVDAQPAERPAVNGTPRKQASRILVVDDSADSTQGFARLLKILGHEVRTAYDGPEAIEVAAAYHPDIIFLDIGLPVLDGYEVARRLREHECCKHSAIIAVSGYGRDDDRRRAREAGFDDHLLKPIDHDALLTVLSRPLRVEAAVSP